MGHGGLQKNTASNLLRPRRNSLLRKSGIEKKQSTVLLHLESGLGWSGFRLQVVRLRVQSVAARPGRAMFFLKPEA
jgi:hypothetical protein